jgi:hypothetical protein
MLTAMIWRMESRTVVAAMVGANCSMDETLDAIWAEVTTQSSALLPVLRPMALRAMRNTTERLRGRHILWHSGVKAGFQERLPPRTTVIFGCIQRLTVDSLASLNRGKQTANNFAENYYNTAQHILPQPFCQLQHSSKSLSTLSNHAM